MFPCVSSADILLAKPKVKGWEMASPYSKAVARVWAQVKIWGQKVNLLHPGPAVIAYKKVFLLDLKGQRRYFCLLITAINRWFLCCLFFITVIQIADHLMEERFLLTHS